MSNARKSDALRHIRTYPSSPRGFDPHEADQDELLRYGFPQRPDPRSSQSSRGCGNEPSRDRSDLSRPSL
jgi:hypothetical protein